MFYAILGIVVVVALFLIFRDDHDKSYNRNEKKAQRQSEGAKRQSSYTKKETSQPKTETQSRPKAEQPKAEFTFEHKATDGAGHKAEFQGEAKKVIGMIGSIIEEVKKEAAEPLQDIQKGAQAVIRSDGKLLGYIPRTQLDWYEDFNEQNVVCPFVGEIELDRSTARLIAEIKVIIPTSQEYVEEEIEDGV